MSNGLHPNTDTPSYTDIPELFREPPSTTLSSGPASYSGEVASITELELAVSAGGGGGTHSNGSERDTSPTKALLYNSIKLWTRQAERLERRIERLEEDLRRCNQSLKEARESEARTKEECRQKHFTYSSIPTRSTSCGDRFQDRRPPSLIVPPRAPRHPPSFGR